ncbi:MAG: CHAT domain-containing protein, partial [Bacteroidota bacterium]
EQLPPMKEISDPVSLLQLLTGKGKVAWYKFQSDPKEAYWLEEGHQNLMLALKLIDRLRLDIPTMEIDSRKYISGLAAVAFEYHLQILTSLHQLTERRQYLDLAFDVMERSKNLALLEEYLNYQPGEAWQDPQKFSVQDSASLYEYWIPSIEELQDTCLSSQSAMLSYFIGENCSFLMAVTKDEVRLVKLRTQFSYTSISEPMNREVLHQQIEQLKKYSSDSARYQNEEAYQQLAYLLFQELVQPVYQLIQTKERLICIPDGPLYEFPIESLVASCNSRKESFQQQDYLVNRHWVSYRLSGALWYHQFQQQRALKLSESLTSFFPTLGELESNEEDSLRAFGPLYQLLGSIGSKTFPPKEATETTFKSLAPKTKVLLIFTHGTEQGQDGVGYLRFDVDANGLIGLPEGEKANDGKLNIEEIYDLQLSCDLVLLVACEGAKGAFQPGEGNFSIARAFHHAGGTHLIAALWQIPIESSARLLTDLLTFIEEGKPIDVALAMAKRKLIQSRTDGGIGAYYTPKDWGGLILFGNPPIKRTSLIPNGWIIFSVLGLFLLISFAYREKLLPLFRRDHFSS